MSYAHFFAQETIKWYTILEEKKNINFIKIIYLIEKYNLIINKYYKIINLGIYSNI